MSDQNLQLNETLKILEKELDTLSIVFSWSYAHYALKRLFLHNIIRCQQFLNVTFHIKNYSVKNQPVRIKYGRVNKSVYPAVKILFRSNIKEVSRHPFFRLLNLRKPISFNKNFKNVKSRSYIYSAGRNEPLTYEERFSELNEILTKGFIKKTNQKKVGKVRAKPKQIDVLRSTTTLNGNSDLLNSDIISIKINGKLEQFSLKQCKVNRKNNIWVRVTGAQYLALNPMLLLEKNQARKHWSDLLQYVKTKKKVIKKFSVMRHAYLEKPSERRLVKFKEQVEHLKNSELFRFLPDGLKRPWWSSKTTEELAEERRLKAEADRLAKQGIFLRTFGKLINFIKGDKKKKERELDKLLTKDELRAMRLRSGKVLSEEERSKRKIYKWRRPIIQINSLWSKRFSRIYKRTRPLFIIRPLDIKKK
jgi:hypothetical protein